MKKIILSLAIFLLVFLVHPCLTLADNEFATSYEVTYNISTNALTQVSQKISLKNLTEQFYASNFSLIIGSTSVSDISASSGDSGNLDVAVDKKGSKTTLNIKLNQQVVGIGKVQVITLNFKSADFVENIGKTWQVSLPRVPSATNLERYDVTLIVPQSFGDPTSIYPTPRSQTQNLSQSNFFFSKEQLKDAGVSASFGSIQLFKFTLKYNLDNNHLYPVITDLALPPNSQYQDVTIDQIDPRPENVYLDEDSNPLATYSLSKNSKKVVTVSGIAKLYIRSKSKEPPKLSEKELISLTRDDQYWSRDNPIIKNKLAEIFKEKVPATDREKAKLIYRFVVDNLKYSTDRLSSSGLIRLGAVTALANPDAAVCMEFTDLFIALARSANVPARELDGYAYTSNKSLRPIVVVENGKVKEFLHAWPEYYDEKNGWVMVDPTWENTSGGVDYFNKFDLSHLVLAIKGFSSVHPSTSDDVKVEITDAEFKPKPEIQVKVDVPVIIWAGLVNRLRVSITNAGNYTTDPTLLSLNSAQLIVLGDKEQKLPSLPPQGQKEYELDLRSPTLWRGFKDTLEIRVAGQKILKEVEVKPLFLFQGYQYAYLGILGIIVLIYGAVLTVHILHKRSV